MFEIIIYIILAFIIGFAVFGIVKRIRHGSSCCGEHEAPPTKIRARDTNKSHYQYVYELNVDGMHCANCARRVENAFNKENGLMAKVDIGKKQVSVWSKTQMSESDMSKIISDSGYTMLSMREL